jgi:hypothetical protein
MKTFSEWLEIRDAEFFAEQDMNRRGFLKGLGAMAGIGAATAVAGAAPSKVGTDPEIVKQHELLARLKKLVELANRSKKMTSLGTPLELATRNTPEERWYKDIQDMIDGVHPDYIQAKKIAREGADLHPITFYSASDLVDEVEELKKVVKKHFLQKTKDVAGKVYKQADRKFGIEQGWKDLTGN